MTNLIETKVQPHIPKGVIRGNRTLLKQLEEGVEVLIDSEETSRRDYPKCQLYCFQQPSQFRKDMEIVAESIAGIQIESIRKRKLMLLPVWAFAHVYMNNAEVRERMNSAWYNNRDTTRLSRTSTALQRKRNMMYIAHQAYGQRTYDTANDNYLLNNDGFVEIDRKKYGLVIPVHDFPRKDVSLDELSKEHPQTAQAMFLMDKDQLKQLVSKNRDPFVSKNSDTQFWVSEGRRHLFSGETLEDREILKDHYANGALVQFGYHGANGRGKVGITCDRALPYFHPDAGEIEYAGVLGGKIVVK